MMLAVSILVGVMHRSGVLFVSQSVVILAAQILKRTHRVKHSS